MSSLWLPDNMKNFSYLLVVWCIALCFLTQSDSQASAQHRSDSVLSVYVDIDASTWKTRGRIFYDVEGSLLRKLATAGFSIVRNKQEPHVFTLSVRYSEEQGVPYAVTKYGTVLKANFSLHQDSPNALWQLHISEFSENSVTGTPPYLDVLQKFDTNPYYFFIGGLLRIFLEQELNAEQALLVLMQQVAIERSSSTRGSKQADRFQEADHSMNSSRDLYLPTAMLRSIEELVRRQDRRAIPVLTRLLDYPHKEVRAGASKALDVLEAL